MNTIKAGLRSVLLLCTAFASPAFAHHFKGLPHFSYFENYPQVPTEEFLGQAGDYEFSLVLYDFQGIKKEDTQQPDDARFYLIAYNLRENRAYQGAATLDILDGDEVVHTEHFESAEEESLYAMQQQLPPTGDYALRLTLHDADDLRGEIPFLLSAQRIHWGKWLAITLAVLVLVVAVGSRRARVMQDRRANAALRHPNPEPRT